MPSCGSRNRPATYLTFHRAWHTSPQSRSASFICPAISQIETLVLDSHEDVGFIHPNAWGRMIFEYLDGLKSAPCTPVGRKIGAQWVTTEAVLVALSLKIWTRMSPLSLPGVGYRHMSSVLPRRPACIFAAR
jgi:hypothetical protein